VKGTQSCGVVIVSCLQVSFDIESVPFGEVVGYSAFVACAWCFAFKLHLPCHAAAR
jgi:hypothetical protein